MEQVLLNCRQLKFGHFFFCLVLTVPGSVINIHVPWEELLLHLSKIIYIIDNFVSFPSAKDAKFFRCRVKPRWLAAILWVAGWMKSPVDVCSPLLCFLVSLCCKVYLRNFTNSIIHWIPFICHKPVWIDYIRVWLSLCLDISSSNTHKCV